MKKTVAVAGNRLTFLMALQKQSVDVMKSKFNFIKLYKVSFFHAFFFFFHRLAAALHDQITPVLIFGTAALPRVLYC